LILLVLEGGHADRKKGEVEQDNRHPRPKSSERSPYQTEAEQCSAADQKPDHKNASEEEGTAVWHQGVEARKIKREGDDEQANQDPSG
jgi:hypothetical protein